MKKQKIEIEIDVPEGFEFVKMDMMKIDGINCYVPAFKEVTPAHQIIDLSCIVGSGIDCEFKPKNGGFWYLDKLEKIDHQYRNFFGLGEDHCRIRQSPHVHFWKGGDKCPLPDGLEVMLYLRCGAMVMSESYKQSSGWSRVNGMDDIIAFEILGTAPGWRYEWEKDHRAGAMIPPGDE